MSTARIPAVLIACASVMTLALCELIYPLHQSIGVDLIGEAITLFKLRNQLLSLRQATDSIHYEILALEDSLAVIAPRPTRAAQDSLYLVVDTHNNKLFVRRGELLLRTCDAATGSNRALTAGGRRWFFTTPKGIMTVRDKRVDPVWIKPDWAFIEAGEPIPPPGSPERLVRGRLGEYALILGGGILIHGTTDLRSLGRNASHGCIRLGSEDLRYVYHATEIGTKVFIF